MRCDGDTIIYTKRVEPFEMEIILARASRLKDGSYRERQWN